MTASWEKGPILIVLPGGELQRTLGSHYRASIAEVIKNRPISYDAFDTIMKKPSEEKPAVVVVPETVDMWDSGEFVDPDTPIQQCDFVIERIREHFREAIPVVIIPNYDWDERFCRFITFPHLSVCHDVAYLGQMCEKAIH